MWVAGRNTGVACNDESQPIGEGRTLKICRDPKEPGSTCQKISAKVLRSAELFRDGHELFIEHEGQLYRLLRTKNNKLILHK